MSEVIEAHGIAVKGAIIHELFEAGVMGQRDDGVVVYHPIIQTMMSPLPKFQSAISSTENNIVALRT